MTFFISSLLPSRCWLPVVGSQQPPRGSQGLPGGSQGLPGAHAWGFGAGVLAHAWGENIDDLGLVPIFKKTISKICDFHFFSFDLCTDIILKQINKIKNLNIFCFFSLFIFLCCFPFFSPLCFPIGVPVVLPRCSPHCGATGTAEATGNCSLSSSTNVRARVGAKRSPRLVALGSSPRGDTTGRHNGETKRETKWKNENEKR